MHPPDELMVEAFLPSLRQLVARELRRQGFSQNKISGMLGTTQASVSLYLSHPVEKAQSALRSMNVAEDEAERYAALLAEDLKRNPLYSVDTLHSIWTDLLGRGMVCDAHRRRDPSLAECDVCIRFYGGRTDERAAAIREVQEAVKVVEASREFVTVMPEVSVNIVCVTAGSESLNDVAAVPGRIVKVKDSARAVLAPEFGASRHLASVLLEVRRKRKDVKAAINLKYDARMAKALKASGLRVLELVSRPIGREGDPTIVALKSMMVRRGDAYDAIVDPGGRTTEPNVYLFAKSAPDAAFIAVRLAKLYSAQ